MCDTMVALPNSTAEQTMLFGKNSDRQRNEAQAVEYVPATTYDAEAQLHCTYISIPQVRRTHAVLLCRPFWIWGAEMGANEHGVVIGNEGLAARSPDPEAPALTGMDLLRLALERACTAAEALEVITTLLERHGQGGNCGHTSPVYYNNGFVIADAHEAFILETVDREWLVERVRSIRTLSNLYSIGPRPDGISRGLRALVHDSGWSSDPEPNYAEALYHPERRFLGDPEGRQACSAEMLRSRSGKLVAAHLMRVLRDHGSGEFDQQQWHMDCTDHKYSICMHAGAKRRGQTTGSMVSEVSGEHAVHWVTGTAAPCISIFKPVLMDVPLPATGLIPTDRFDPRALWWRHERIHRAAAMTNLESFRQRIACERDALEAQFNARIAEVLNGGAPADRSRAVEECWQQALEMEDRWYTHLVMPAASPSDPYHAAWDEVNRLAELRLEQR
jgi:secernin